MYNKAGNLENMMTVVFKILRFIAILIIAFFIASIFKMPWPANIIIGGFILLSILTILVYEFLSRKTKKNTGQTEE